MTGAASGREQQRVEAVASAYLLENGSLPTTRHLSHLADCTKTRASAVLHDFPANVARERATPSASYGPAPGRTDPTPRQLAIVDAARRLGVVRAAIELGVTHQRVSQVLRDHEKRGL